MSEWISPFNPFNSMKALVHADKFESILEQKAKSPIVVNMDLTNKCNYDCGFCMFANRERADPDGKSYRKNESLPKGYVLTLPKLWKNWGVKGVCLAGGGEPSLHPDFKPFIEECHKNNLDLGIATNGYLLSDDLDYLSKCKFVGFSMDAGNSTDYAKVKGVPYTHFYKVLDNMKKVSQTGTEVGYKFLLDKDNQNGIYGAAQLAKQVGARHFQFRPAIDTYQYSKEEIQNIKNQITRAQNDFEDENFQVMGVTHKFNSDFTKKHDFSKCRANMLTSTWCADGNVYLCTDTRGSKWSKLGAHYPNPEKFIKEVWNSKEHWNKVNQINTKYCDRCTLGPYNTMFEKVFIEDNMDKNLI